MAKVAMSPGDFRAWQENMRLSNNAAAKRLGISRMSVLKYRDIGAPLPISLACAAVAWGLPAWSHPVEPATAAE